MHLLVKLRLVTAREVRHLTARRMAPGPLGGRSFEPSGLLSGPLSTKEATQETLCRDEMFTSLVQNLSQEPEIAHIYIYTADGYPFAM